MGIHFCIKKWWSCSCAVFCFVLFFTLNVSLMLPNCLWTSVSFIDTEQSQKWLTLLYMYTTLLYCSVPACAEFLFTLENNNIKSWLSVGQTLNHNNWYPYAILIITWNSITKTRFFFFFSCATQGLWESFLKVSEPWSHANSRCGA